MGAGVVCGRYETGKFREKEETGVIAFLCVVLGFFFTVGFTPSIIFCVTYFLLSWHFDICVIIAIVLAVINFIHFCKKVADELDRKEREEGTRL